MTARARIRDQLQRNAVALISLVIAITSLGYNTWRNEVSEYNRTQRAIAVEVLRNLGDLQQVVYHNAWDMDVTDKGNPRTGWVHVLAVRDLAQLLAGEVDGAATRLLQAWEGSWESLNDRDAYERVVGALEDARRETHALLRDLD